MVKNNVVIEKLQIKSSYIKISGTKALHVNRDTVITAVLTQQSLDVTLLLSNRNFVPSTMVLRGEAAMPALPS